MFCFHGLPHKGTWQSLDLLFLFYENCQKHDFGHGLGRRRSSGRDTTAVWHRMSSRIQWDQFWILNPTKSVYILLLLCKLCQGNDMESSPEVAKTGPHWPRKDVCEERPEDIHIPPSPYTPNGN